MKLMMTPQSRVLTPGTLLGTFLSAITVLTARADLTNCAPPPAGLVSWWAAEGDASDVLGANNGLIQGGVGFAKGKVGMAFNFDGSSAYVNIPASASLDVGAGGGLTIECWIKPAALADAQPVAEWNNGAHAGAHFWISQPPPYGGGWGSIYVNLIDTTGVFHPLTTGGGILNTNGFQHVAMTYDKASGAVRLYYNGEMAASQTLGSFAPQTRYDLYLGKRVSDAPFVLFHGAMDEASLYRRALTGLEIQAIYHAGSAGKCIQSTAPSIVVQPQSQTVNLGATVSLNVATTGAEPLSYQWNFNGAPLSGATRNPLSLTNAQPCDAGTYAVVVTNAYGSATSSNALLTVNAVSCVSTPSNLVGWWLGQGDATDATGTNSGAAHGALTFASGEVGSAFNFDGSSAYVRIPPSASLNVGTSGGLTVECWINPASATANQALVEWNTGLGQLGVHLWISQPPPYGGGAGSIYVNLIDTAGAFHTLTTGGGILNTNGFQHVALTYDKASGAARLYYNGVQAASQSLGSFSPQTSLDLHLGERPGNASSYYRGLMDEVSLYNRALGAAEILAIYNAASAGKCGLAPSVQTPPSSQTVECSSNATFVVTASGLPPLTYRWYFGTNLILGATSKLFTLTNAGFAQAGNYSVVVTNAYGSASGGPAVLKVVDTIPPTIISCASNRTLSAGANCTASLPDLTGEVIAIDASGSVTVTQNPSPGTLLGLGITNMAFAARDSSGNTSVCASSVTVVDTTPPFVQACVLEVTLGFDTNCQALLPDLTSTNYIVATDNCSSVSVAQAPPAHTVLPVGTNVVLLTVSDSASNQTTRAVSVVVAGEPQIVLPPTNLSAVLTSNAAFSVTACGALPLLYQWQHFSTNLPSATNAAFTIASVNTNDAGDYTAVIANPAGSVTSVVATLTVLRPPVITRQPRSVAAAPGGSASFSAAVQGRTPLAYQWQRNGAPLAGQTKLTVTIASIQTEDFGAYTIEITNADGSALSGVAMLTQAVSPAITSLSFNSETFMLTVPTEVGPTYVVEYKDTLEDHSWNVLTTIDGTGFPIPITDNGLTNETRFYRVRVR